MTLGDRIATAARARAEGEAWVRERTSGRVHRVTLRAGRVVGARVAGAFDPLLLALVRAGALAEARYWDVLEALAGSERRAGDLAVEIGGVAATTVRDVVEAQVRSRIAAALRATPAQTGFASRTVPPRERIVSLEPSDLVSPTSSDENRHTSCCVDPRGHRNTFAVVGAEEGRRRLRRLARELHPDRHGGADQAVRAAMAARLAEATAAYHGLR